ncbi:sensor histidine kinase [Loktanella sp. Alg231-35]|uniref:sensor histidine kinase n=1 Tax=Loktanella sp. Alg231-35 TaxID=1922220 RepID=UPI000D54D886|nr:HAMP domain-containing sensor histidine kinase [Loktanella sp. Alg231-35]
MKITHVVNGFAAVMLVTAMVSVSVASWAARKSDYHNHRISLAHSSYEYHLALTADTYLTFKRFGDLLLIGDPGEIEDLELLATQLRGHIANIRQTIEQEILLVGDEELEELELLARVEELIEELIAQFQTILALEDLGDERTNWREVSQLLSNGLKNDFRSLIEIALTEEQEEVAETEAEARYQMMIVRRMSFGLGMLSLFLTVFALHIFRRKFTRPLKRLLVGVRGFADGDFRSRIKLRGRSELSEISMVLDEMAEVVADKTEALTLENEKLDAAVKERTKTLEHLLAEARQSEVNRRQLLADVSHELRTPLTVIQGESDIALRGSDKTSAEYKEALRRARTAATHTANLVNDLLFMSRNEAGVLRLSREPIDVVELLNEVIAISGTDAKLTPSQQPVFVNADRQRIRQAVLALLHNAEHHGGEDIQVALNEYPDNVEISISDDGSGMADDEKKHAFERFFRGSNATTRYADGLGLGLPIVRSIAEAHGGYTRINDRPEGGTIVSVSLPRIRES